MKNKLVAFHLILNFIIFFSIYNTYLGEGVVKLRNIDNLNYLFYLDIFLLLLLFGILFSKTVKRIVKFTITLPIVWLIITTICIVKTQVPLKLFYIASLFISVISVYLVFLVFKRNGEN